MTRSIGCLQYFSCSLREKKSPLVVSVSDIWCASVTFPFLFGFPLLPAGCWAVTQQHCFQEIMRNTLTSDVITVAHFLLCGLVIHFQDRLDVIQEGEKERKYAVINAPFYRWTVLFSLIVPRISCSCLGGNALCGSSCHSSNPCLHLQLVIPASAKPRVAACSLKAWGWRRPQTSRFTPRGRELANLKSPSKARVSLMKKTWNCIRS